MKSGFTAAAAIALAMAASSASAGVVISQELAISNQPVGRKTDQTVMIQGHKRIVITGDQEVVTDLDAGKMYLIDTKDKQFLQISFPPADASEKAVMRQGISVEFKKTDWTQQVAGYDCQVYSGRRPVLAGAFVATECVASGAPGAKEFVEFQKAMAAKLKGTPMAIQGEIPNGIPVFSTITRTVNPFRPPRGVTPEQAAKINAALAKHKPPSSFTTVTKIEAKNIAADKFAVPAGYTKARQPAMPQLKPMPGMRTPPGMTGTAPKTPSLTLQPMEPDGSAAPAAPAPH